MIELITELWDNLLKSPVHEQNKLICVITLLHIYAALLGITDEDFADITHEMGEEYEGPIPDNYSEFILNYYHEQESSDHER